MEANALALPVELYHQIFLSLDISDILALRMTCKRFLALTQERSFWSAMFTRLRATQALPYSRTEFMAMSFSQAQRVLFAAYKVEASFLEPRDKHRILVTLKQPSSSTNASTSSWRILAFVSDRFLLAVDNTAIVIWDTSTSPTVAFSPWAHFTLSNFIGYADCYSTLYIAAAHVHVGHRSAAIYSVSLPPLGASEDHQGRLHLEAEFSLLETELLKDIDPDSGRALLYFPSTSIHVLHWRDNNRRSTIDIQLDDFDEGWNGITSLRFCGPYVLCFRVRSVEAYPVPVGTPTADPLPMLRHRFGSVCFRAVSLSHVRVSRCPSGEVYTVFMLSNDVYEGMFHYCIRVTTSPVPSMSVKVLAKGSIRMSEPLPLVQGTDIGYTLDDMIRRTFVPTWSLGSAGLRGVWVDRLRGSIDRRVVAFTTHPSRLRIKETPLVPAMDALDTSEEAPTMDGNVVHVISSYDLRDDITMCVVSEWTGRIALGSRAGAILLL